MFGSVFLRRRPRQKHQQSQSETAYLIHSFTGYYAPLAHIFHESAKILREERLEDENQILKVSNPKGIASQNLICADGRIYLEKSLALAMVTPPYSRMTDIDILRQISEGRRTFIPEREQAPYPEFQQTVRLLFSLEDKRYVKEVVTRLARHDQPSRNYYTSATATAGLSDAGQQYLGACL